MFICDVCGASHGDMFLDWDTNLVMCKECTDKTTQARIGGFNSPRIFEPDFLDRLLRL